MAWLTEADTNLSTLIRSLRLLLETTGALWITVGFVFALAELISAHVRRQLASFTRIRLTFTRYLSLALEFQLASDILSTSIAPTWDEIGKLGATAVIRTALNYFLTREKQEYTEQEKRECEVAGLAHEAHLNA